MLDDQNAGAWADAAIAEISAEHDDRLGDPRARLPAFDALTALAGLLSGASRLRLGHGGTADRPACRPAPAHRHGGREDPPGGGDPACRRRAPAGPGRARRSADGGNRPDRYPSFPPEQQKAIGGLLTATAATSEPAGLIVIVTGVRPASVLGAARDQVDRYLAAREHRPVETAFYAGTTHIALFASVIEAELRDRAARTMLDRAADRARPHPAGRAVCAVCSR